MSLADFVVRLDATESIFIPASSQTLPNRDSSLIRDWINFLRYRVTSRIAAMSAGGMKLPRSSPTSSSWASHSLSFTSVLRPGTFFTCPAFTRRISKPASTSHRAWNTGRQYTPVDSIVTCVTRCSTSQATMTCSTG